MRALHAHLCGQPANRGAAGPPQQLRDDLQTLVLHEGSPPHWTSLARHQGAQQHLRHLPLNKDCFTPDGEINLPSVIVKASSPSPSTTIFMAAKALTSSSSSSTVPPFAPVASPPLFPAPPASSLPSSLPNGSTPQNLPPQTFRQSLKQTVSRSISTPSSAPPAAAPPTPSTSPCLSSLHNNGCF